mmetsp:Transcript_7094/g.29530  ORF Transcript_7094/g.29530 Transcript_7094/m.29530 type:complete len:447 (-) Transcript_7094:227-1567(-)
MTLGTSGEDSSNRQTSPRHKARVRNRTRRDSSSGKLEESFHRHPVNNVTEGVRWPQRRRRRLPFGGSQQTLPLLGRASTTSSLREELDGRPPIVATVVVAGRRRHGTVGADDGRGGRRGRRRLDALARAHPAAAPHEAARIGRRLVAAVVGRPVEGVEPAIGTDALRSGRPGRRSAVGVVERAVGAERLRVDEPRPEPAPVLVVGEARAQDLGLERRRPVVVAEQLGELGPRRLERRPSHERRRPDRGPAQRRHVPLVLPAVVEHDARLVVGAREHGRGRRCWRRRPRRRLIIVAFGRRRRRRESCRVGLGVATGCWRRRRGGGRCPRGAPRRDEPRDAPGRVAHGRRGAVRAGLERLAGLGHVRRLVGGCWPSRRRRRRRSSCSVGVIVVRGGLGGLGSVRVGRLWGLRGGRVRRSFGRPNLGARRVVRHRGRHRVVGAALWRRG